MYNSCKPTIISAINLLNTDPSFDGHINSNKHHKRSLLPFLGNALRWLTGTATSKMSMVTLVHVVSILNITRYAAQVNRHSINVLMDKVDETSHDVQLNYLIDHQSQLSSTHTIHQIRFSKPFRLTILHYNSFYTHYGLH